MARGIKNWRKIMNQGEYSLDPEERKLKKEQKSLKDFMKEK